MRDPGAGGTRVISAYASNYFGAATAFDSLLLSADRRIAMFRGKSTSKTALFWIDLALDTNVVVATGTLANPFITPDGRRVGYEGTNAWGQAACWFGIAICARIYSDTINRV